MQDPNTPEGSWQQVPPTPGDPVISNAPPGSGAGYAPPDYPNSPTPNYPPPPEGGYQTSTYPPAGAPGYTPQAAGISPSTAAAISYLTFIPAIIFLVLDPYKRIPLVRFHAIQSIALNVVAIAIGIVLGILTVPLVLAGMWPMASMLHSLVNLAMFIAWLVVIIQAAQGKWFKLPLIGDIALKMAQK